MMDWDWLLDTVLKVGGALAGLVGMIGGGLAWAARRTLVTQDDLRSWQDAHDTAHDDLTERLARGEARFARLETTLANLPTKDEVADLRIKMERLSGDIRVATAILQRVEHPVRTIVESALEGKE